MRYFTDKKYRENVFVKLSHAIRKIAERASMFPDISIVVFRVPKIVTKNVIFMVFFRRRS